MNQKKFDIKDSKGNPVGVGYIPVFPMMMFMVCKCGGEFRPSQLQPFEGKIQQGLPAPINYLCNKCQVSCLTEEIMPRLTHVNSEQLEAMREQHNKPTPDGTEPGASFDGFGTEPEEV